MLISGWHWTVILLPHQFLNKKSRSHDQINQTVLQIVPRHFIGFYFWRYHKLHFATYLVSSSNSKNNFLIETASMARKNEQLQFSSLFSASIILLFDRQKFVIVSDSTVYKFLPETHFKPKNCCHQYNWQWAWKSAILYFLTDFSNRLTVTFIADHISHGIISSLLQRLI